MHFPNIVRCGIYTNYDKTHKKKIPTFFFVLQTLKYNLMLENRLKLMDKKFVIHKLWGSKFIGESRYIKRIFVPRALYIHFLESRLHSDTYTYLSLTYVCIYIYMYIYIHIYIYIYITDRVMI